MNTDALNELKEYKIKLFTKINFLLEDLLSVSNERVKKATNDLINELKMELGNVDKKIEALTNGNNDAIHDKNEKYEDNSEKDNDGDEEDSEKDEEEDDDEDKDDSEEDEEEDDDEDKDDSEEDDDEEDDSEEDHDDDANQDNSSSSSGEQSVYVGRKDNGDVVAIFNEE